MTADTSFDVTLCSWVIANDYYDGPISGVGLRAKDQATVYFRAVAWDSEQWNRVFAIATVSQDLVDRLRQALAALESPKEPLWLPGPSTNHPDIVSLWESLEAEANASECWYLVESHDLFKISEEVPAPSGVRDRLIKASSSRVIMSIHEGAMIPSFIQEAMEK